MEKENLTRSLLEELALHTDQEKIDAYTKKVDALFAK